MSWECAEPCISEDELNGKEFEALYIRDEGNFVLRHVIAKKCTCAQNCDYYVVRFKVTGETFETPTTAVLPWEIFSLKMLRNLR